MKERAEIREQRYLDITSYLLNYINEFQWPPTIDEICQDVGINSKSLVRGYLNKLANQGVIERGDGAREIRFTLRPHPVEFQSTAKGLKSGPEE